MLLDTLQDKLPAWFSDAESGPEGEMAVLSQCSLGRNLADFPFPAQCSNDEQQAVLDRVAGVLDNLNLLASGRFYRLKELDPEELRFLAERRFISHDVLLGNGQRGVYVSDDQCLSIMVNGEDHLCLRTMQAGQKIHEAWARLNLMDDTLSGVLDFAFNERLGFLTSSLRNLGTGLRASTLVHLPGLALEGRIVEQAEAAKQRHVLLQGVALGAPPGAKEARESRKTAPPWEDKAAPGVNDALFSGRGGALCCSLKEARGDLFLLENQYSLGVSEDEVIFRLREAAQQILAEERRAQQRLLAESRCGVEDRVGRARGIAGGAHVLGFEEGIGLLSSIRLGIAAGLLPTKRVGVINELLLESQGAHLEMAAGRACTELDLNTRRADLFRSRFN